MTKKKPGVFVLILFVSLSSLLTSCGTTPPDVPLCDELSTDEAYCIHTISSKEFYINEKNLYNGKTWWEIRNKMIRLPIESWVEIKKFIIKICKTSNKCNGTSITSWERTVGIIDEKIYKTKASK